MLNIRQLVVGPLSSNCYLVSINNNKKCLIIDPGDDFDYISEFIQKNNLIPEAILLTHGHLDHIKDSLILKGIYNIDLYISEKDLFFFNIYNKSFNLNKNLQNHSKSILILDKMDEQILSKYYIKIFKTPGHTPGSVTYEFTTKNKKYLFCGDLIFKGGNIGRYDFKYSSKKDHFKSIRKIVNLNENHIIYPGHGEKFVLGDFINDFKKANHL